MKNKNIFVRFLNFLLGKSIKKKSKIVEPIEDVQSGIIQNNSEQETPPKTESQFNIVLGICRFLSNTPHNFEVTFSVVSIKRNLKWLDAKIDDIQLNKVLHRMRKRGVLIPVKQTKKYFRKKEYKLSKKWR